MQRSTSIHLSRSGFTMVELLTSVAICAVLAGLLLPVGMSFSRKSQATKCSTNLRQIGTALQSYAADNNNFFPAITDPVTRIDWDTSAIAPYIPQRPDGRQGKSFICPSAKYRGHQTPDLSRTYSASDALMGYDNSTGAISFTFTVPRNRSTIANPSSTIMLYDGVQSGSNRFSEVVRIWNVVSAAQDLKTTSGSTTCIDFRHDGNAHALCADGHVISIARQNAPTITKSMWQGL